MRLLNGRAAPFVADSKWDALREALKGMLCHARDRVSVELGARAGATGAGARAGEGGAGAGTGTGDAEGARGHKDCWADYTLIPGTFCYHNPVPNAVHPWSSMIDMDYGASEGHVFIMTERTALRYSDGVDQKMVEVSRHHAAGAIVAAVDPDVDARPHVSGAVVVSEPHLRKMISETILFPSWTHSRVGPALWALYYGDLTSVLKWVRGCFRDARGCFPDARPSEQKMKIVANYPREVVIRYFYRAWTAVMSMRAPLTTVVPGQHDQDDTRNGAPMPGREEIIPERRFARLWDYLSMLLFNHSEVRFHDRGKKTECLPPNALFETGSGGKRLDYIKGRFPILVKYMHSLTGDGDANAERSEARAIYIMRHMMVKDSLASGGLDVLAADAPCKSVVRFDVDQIPSEGEPVIRFDVDQTLIEGERACPEHFKALAEMFWFLENRYDPTKDDHMPPLHSFHPGDGSYLPQYELYPMPSRRVFGQCFPAVNSATMGLLACVPIQRIVPLAERYPLTAVEDTRNAIVCSCPAYQDDPLASRSERKGISLPRFGPMSRNDEREAAYGLLRDSFGTYAGDDCQILPPTSPFHGEAERMAERAVRRIPRDPRCIVRQIDHSSALFKYDDHATELHIADHMQMSDHVYCEHHTDTDAEIMVPKIIPPGGYMEKKDH